MSDTNTLFQKAIQAGLDAAPELYNSPGAAVAVGQSAMNSGLDPTQNGQAVAHASNIASLNDSQNTVVKKTSGSWWKHALGDVIGGVYKVGHVVNQATFGVAGNVIGDVNHIANAGLQEVQHQYRYLHDVEARHGFFAAALDGVGILGGAGVGAFFGGPEGAVLGADAVGAAEGRINHVDSWNRTANGAQYQGTYDRQTGKYSGPKGQVSFGRDLVSAVGLHRNSLLSGIADAVFDLNMDPEQAALGIAKGIQAGQYVAKTGEEFDNIITKSSVQRKIADLANQDAAQIAQDSRLAPIATELGDAKTPSEVASVLRNAWEEGGMRTQKQMIPHTSIPTEVTQRLSNAVQNYTGPGSKVTHALTSYTKEAIDYTGEKPELAGSVKGGYVLPVTDGANIKDYEEWLNKAVPWKNYTITHATDGTELAEPLQIQHAKDITHGLALEFAAAGDAQTRMNIVTNHLRYLAQEVGGLEPADAQKVSEAIRPALINNLEAGTKGFMGFDNDNTDLSQAAKVLQDGTEGSQAQAIWKNQQGNLIIPDARTFNRSLQQVSSVRKAGWAMDDWLAAHPTKAFKALAVVSPATYERIMLNESLPEFMHSPLGYLKNLVGNSFAKSSFDALDSQQHDDTAASSIYSFARAKNLWHKAGDFTDNLKEAVSKDPVGSYVAQRLAAENNGRAISTAVVGSKDLAQADIGIDKSGFLDTMAHMLGTPTLKDGAWKTYDNTDDDHADAWLKQLAGLKTQPSAKAGAKTLLDSLKILGPGEISDEDMANLHELTKQAILTQLSNEDKTVLSGFGRLYGVDEDGKVSLQLDQKLKDLADVQARALRGLTAAPKGEGNLYHTDILDAIANDKNINPKLLDNIPLDQRPLNVNGRPLVEVPAKGWIARGTEIGWKKLGDPMMESMSRGPQFQRRMTDEMQYWADRAASTGVTMEPDDIWRKALESSIVAMQPMIHNPTERSIFGDMARNFMPFYYAQEQAYKRLGRLAINDPQAFMRERIAANAISNAGSTVTDANGNQQFVYPAAGFLHGSVMKALGVAGIPMAGSVPVSIGAQLKGVSTVIPGSEGTAPQFGPLVSMPLHLLQNWMPESAPLVHGVLGDVGASGSIWDQVLPNATLRNTVEAFTQDHSRSFQNAMMNTIQAMSYHDDSDPQVRAWNDAYALFAQVQTDPNAANDPKDVFAGAVKALTVPSGLSTTQAAQYKKGLAAAAADFIAGKGMSNYPGMVPPAAAGDQQMQQFIDRVRNQTRVNFLFRAALGAVVPASPTLEFGNAGLRAEYQTLIQKEGISQASIDFLKKNPDATAYTVFETKATDGTNLPATAQGMDWVNKNSKLIKQYPYGAAWLVPQPTGKADAFSSTAYNEQLATHARLSKQPDEFVKDLYIAKGNAEYYNDAQPAYLKKLAAASNDSVAKQQVQAQWSQFLQAFGAQNPVWYSDHLSGDRQTNRTLAIDQLNQIFSRNQAPAGKQSDDVRQLLVQYEQYREQALTADQNFGTGGKDTLNKTWQNHLDQVKREEPNLGPIIDKIFRVETA